jgi:hypothetical protein
MTGQQYQDERARQEAAEEAERLKQKEELDAYIAEKKAHFSELEKKAAALRRKLGKDKVGVTIVTPTTAPEPKRERDRYVAIHEAGHAVCSRLKGMPVFKAIIEGKGNGLVTYSAVYDKLPESERPPLAPGFYETSLLCSLSGPAAELLDDQRQFFSNVRDGCYMHDCGHFFEVACKHLALQNASTERWLEAATQSGTGLNKAAKENSELWLKEPGTVPPEIWQLYDKTFAEARTLLGSNWPAVQRVAEALLKQGELDQAKIDELIGPEILGEQPDQGDAE